MAVDPIGPDNADNVGGLGSSRSPPASGNGAAETDPAWSVSQRIAPLAPTEGPSPPLDECERFRIGSIAKLTLARPPKQWRRQDFGVRSCSSTSAVQLWCGACGPVCCCRPGCWPNFRLHPTLNTKTGLACALLPCWLGSVSRLISAAVDLDLLDLLPGCPSSRPLHITNPRHSFSGRRELIESSRHPDQRRSLACVKYTPLGHCPQLIVGLSRLRLPGRNSSLTEHLLLTTAARRALLFHG